VPPRYNVDVAKSYLAFTLTATPAATGVSSVRRTYAMQLGVLLAATAVVLLITCANLANLMLARATAREREVGVRLAIGASRGRIVRQLLSESLLLAALGAVGGALLARWLSEALVGFLSTENNRLFVDLSPDWRVFVFIAGVAAVACLLFGLSPALKVTATSPATALQATGRSTDSRERFAVRRALVVVQMALSMVLIVGALLFARSLRNLLTVDPGFVPGGILAINVDVRRAHVERAAWAQTFAQVMERVRAVPGVRHAAETYIVPVSGSGWNQNVIVDGEVREGPANLNRVGSDYFRATGTPLLAGRPFGPQDRPGAPQAAIVNETFARKYFGGANPIGRTFQLQMNQGDPQPHHPVVGLVKDTKYTDVREELMPIAYFAASQEEDRDVDPYLDLVVRSDLPASSIAPAITRAVLEVAPGSTVAYDTVRRYIRDSLATERLMASLSAFFGLLALLIATIGLYGVISYMVRRRQVEIGIRMALGAEPRSVVGMILRESGVLLAAGLAAGVTLAILAARSAASLLYGLEPWDPASFAAAAAVLGVVSLIAAWIPARRAARLTPTIALRE
jgi:putative ABC transport system permease protein